MNYEQAMEYIHAVQWAGHKPGLSRTRTLLAALGDPHKRLRFVHVAGTNGKGSTAAMLASCLQAAGYRVGLFTSPFINRFNERIQVDGQQIPDEELVRLVEQVQPAADRGSPDSASLTHARCSASGRLRPGLCPAHCTAWMYSIACS